VVTSLNTKKEFSEITKTPIDVITNGYENVEGIESNLDPAFSLVHIGSLLSNRNPKILWKVLAEICKENENFKKDLHIKLVGIVGEEISESIRNYSLKNNCEFIGYVSHIEAIQLQKKAQVLLMVEMDTPETKAIIPGKLFEYLAAKRPIIAIGPEGSDVASIIDETNSGYYFNYSEEEKLREELLSYYEKYKLGKLSVDSQNISKYSRRELTSRMSKVLKELFS